MTIATHDLPALMRNGLRWDVRHIVPKFSFWAPRSDADAFMPTGLSSSHQSFRSWKVTQCTDTFFRQSKWKGTVTVWTDSFSTLAGFRLDMLCGSDIDYAVVHNNRGNQVFLYDRSADKIINCMDETGRASVYWLWPEKCLEEAEKNGLEFPLRVGPTLRTLEKESRHKCEERSDEEQEDTEEEETEQDTEEEDTEHEKRGRKLRRGVSPHRRQQSAETSAQRAFEQRCDLIGDIMFFPIFATLGVFN
ncbi:hypothetical protein QBC47DRAFT_356746 [Echria macrotheca]|uniref:Uncharacterized protein n=1 Tax=Echria macrotheca TaxID=438768 RepID=A0AAJ0BIC2_9PEZI|nr:hypothetical protein QBC47DRAFT_356746 [Echria macrotheca]